MGIEDRLNYCIYKSLCLNVVDGLVVYPKVIEKHMMAELPEKG